MKQWYYNEATWSSWHLNHRPLDLFFNSMSWKRYNISLNLVMMRKRQCRVCMIFSTFLWNKPGKWHFVELNSYNHVRVQPSPAPGEKWPAYGRGHFPIHFHELKFWFEFHWKHDPEGSIDNKTVLVQVMARRRPGGQPLPEPWWPVRWRITASGDEF